MKKQYSNKSGKKASGHYSLGNKKQARKPLITALEPRLLLDGAAVATAVDVLTDSQLHDASQIDNSHQGSDTSFVVAPTEVRAVDPSLNNGKKEVVFIEDNVADYQSLIDGANTGVEVVLLDSTQDGLAQMAEWAKTHSDYDAIHVISHGAEGQVNLGGFSLDNITVKTRSADLAQLGAALNEEGDLLLYGCSVASGEGQDFITALAQATQADVAASDDLTGADSLGGDWWLEKSVGDIGVSIALSVDITENYERVFVDETSFDFESNTTTTSGIVKQEIDAYTLVVNGKDTDLFVTTVADFGGAYVSTPLDDDYDPSGYESEITLSFSNGEVFDISSISIFNMILDDQKFTFTPYVGNTVGQPALFDIHTSGSFQTINLTGFTNITKLIITSSENSGEFAINLDNIVVSNITLPISDTTAPTVTSIDRQTPSDSTTDADSVVYRVTFDEAVSGIDTTDFNVSGTTATVTNVSSAGGNTYDVTVSGGDLVALNSTVTLSFASGQNITDTAGNALTATTPTGTNNSIYDVVNTPTVTTGDNTGDNLTFSNYTEDLADGGGLSLVEALHYASANQTVAFDLASGSTVNMNGGTLTVASGVTFDTDAMSALTISNGTLSLGGNVTFTNGTSDVLTVSSKLAGSNMLIKSGAGTLNLTSNANGSSSFATTVSAGTLAIGSVSNIGSGAISLSDATTFKVTEITSLANSVTLTGNSTIQTDGRLTLNNTVSGSGYTLTKAGSQSLTLAGTNSGSSLATTITAGNLIISSDANLGSGELTLNGGTLYLQSASDIITHDITLGSSGGTIQVTGSADATVSGNITGSGALTKGGGRVLTLSGSNSFSGGFNIAGSANSGGTNVIVADGTNLGTGAVMLTKGLQLTGSGTITNDFVLNGGLISNANSVILSGILSGSGAMEKVDTGSLTLSGTNTYTGTTTVSAGTLTGTTSSLTGNIVNNAAVEFSQSTAGEYSKVISGTGTVTKSGSGILTLSGVNTYTGSTTVSSGGLTLVGGSNIADTSAVTLASAATLTLSGGNETIGSLAGAGNVVLGYRLTMGGNNTDTTFSGVISSTNTSGITKTGSGIFTLSGTNTYIGATAVSAGTLMVSSGSAIADASAVTVASGATFELDASVSETVGSIAGAGSIFANGGTLTVGGDNSSTTFSGVMSERSDALSLVKIGGGTLTLSGNNTYTGATTLSGGTLSVTGTMNGSGAGVFTVNAGTLEGSGTINSAVTVNAGATLSAGVAANTGTLTINGNLFLDEDSTLSATLSGASNYDKIVVNGSVELNNAQLTLSGDYVVPAAAEAQSFELLSNDGSDAITGNFFSLTEGDAKTFKDVDLATSYVGSTGNDFLLTGPTIASVTGVSATTDDGYYKVGDAIEITVIFSKAVTVDTTNGTPQLTLETGTTDRAATYVSGSGTNTLTFNYTVQDGDTSADLDYLSTAALVLSDGAIKDGTNDAILTLPTLNASGSLAANKAIVIDTTAPDAPTVDLSSDSDTGSSSTDNITNDNTPTLTGTAEANATVTLYDTDDTTSLGTTTADGSGNWTITSSALSAGAHTLTTKVTDAAGNVSLASSGLTITIDTAGPILSSSSPVDDAVQVTQSGDIILTFDEDITKGYDTITLVNVTTGVTVETFDVLNGGNLTYSGNTLTLNPTNDLEEATTYAIRVDGNAVRDTAGNTYAGISDNATLNFTTGVMDSAAPAFLSIQRTSDAVVTGSTTSFTLTFNEAVDVTAADFVLATTGSVAGAIGSISGSGTNSITVNVTGVSGVGSLGLNLASGHAVKDLAGNNLATSEPADDEAYTVDTVAPTLISINRVDSETTNADSVQFMAVFSENVTGLSADDFELTGTATSGASIDSVIGAGNGYVITVSGVSGDGSLGVQLNSAATVTDTAINALTATTASAVTEQYTIDNTAPTATAIITTNTALSTADTVTFDVTFDEAVANVTADDFEISGDVTGTISAVSGSGSSYTVTVASIMGDGALGLSFKSGQNITDAAGNALAGTEPTTDESYTIDNILPTVTSISRGMVNQVEANTATDVVFTVVMSETVTGIETSDFAVTGNASNTGVSNVSSSDGKVFKVTVSGVNGTIGQTVGLSFTGSADDALSQASTAQFTSGDSYTIAGTLLNEGALSQAQLDALVDLNREGTLLEQSVDGAKEVVIVDSRVPGLVDLTKESNPNADVWLLDGSRSATEQITEILANYNDLDALHILSHGGVGEVYLGAETISGSSITENSDVYAAWGNALSDNGDILLYGCNVAQGDMGVDFINQLAQVTGADIAASDDLTGSAVLGGDWVLEMKQGNVDNDTLDFGDDFESALTTPTFTVQPAATDIEAGQVTLTATHNQLGGIGYVILADGATAPTNVQVAAGKDGDGNDALFSGFNSGYISAGTEISVTIGGLNSGTNYDVYITGFDKTDPIDGSNDTAPILVEFTTLSITVPSDGTQTFAGAIVLNGIATSPDGFFTTTSIDGSGDGKLLKADQYGAFISYSSTPATSTYTSSMIVKANDGGTFELTDITLGEYEKDGDTTNSNFENIQVLGYLDNVLVAQTTPFTPTSDTYTTDYNNPNFSPFSGVTIDEFRVSFDVTNGDEGHIFSLFDFSVKDAALPSAPDVIAPVFDTTPAASNIADTTLDLATDVNEAGKVYYVVVADGSQAPTAAQVKAGVSYGDNNGRGATVITSGNAIVSSGDFSNTFNVSGLTASTAYDIYVVAEDDEGTPNLQSSVTKVDVTTIAPANQAPTISDAAANQTVDDNATVSPFNAITLADVDGDNVSVTVALDTAAKGVFTAASLTSSGFTNAGSGSYTLSSTSLASAQAALRALVFDATDNRVAVGLTESTTFTITVNDGTTNGIDSTTTVVSTSINDAPTDIVLSDTTYGHSEGATNVVVGSFSATDADTGESFTYSLVSGVNDTDNAKFNINGADLRVTDRASVPAGTYSIRVQVNDGDATFEKSFSITVSDDIAPTISAVVPADNATGVSVADSIQVTFDEGVQLGSSGTITLYDITGNGANSLTIDVNNHNGQLSIVGNKLTINPTNNLMATNQYAIQITAGALTDSSDNALAAISDIISYNFTTGTVDTTAPTVAIVDIADPTQPNAGTVTINFSEQVTNVDISDFTLTKDGSPVSLSGLTVEGSGSAYTLNLSSVTTAEGIYVLTLNTSDIADTSGNVLSVGDSETFIIDTTAPTGVAIVRAGADTQSGSAATFTAVFSEAVSGVDTADFVLTGTAAGGSITSVTQVSDSVYTVAVNGVSSDGTLGVNLKDSGTGITDTAGNAIGAGVTGQQITIDNTGPSVVAINRDGAVLTTADSATYTVTFNEAVTGVDVSDFSLSGGASGTVASISGSGATYQVTVNNISGDGSLRLDLNASGTGITDTVSNAIGAGFTSGDTLTIDNTTPVVTASQAFNLDEGMVADTVIGQVKATDTNGVSQFSIQSGNDNGYFAIDNNGVVTLTSVGAAAIDYETATSYTLNIVATDAVGQASTAAAVTISINDINDNAPVFSSAATATLAENTAVTTVVYDANATDADGTSVHNSVTYSLKVTDDHNAFTIDSTTGEVKLKASADYETKSSYSFTVIASDGMRSTEQDVTLSITDVNEAPIANNDTDTATEAGGVDNGTAGTNASGNVLTNDTDVDSGDTKTVTAIEFGATNGALGQAVSGDYGQLTLNADGSYTYVVDNTNATVQALQAGAILTETFTYTLSDAVGLTDTATLVITINGANDNPTTVVSDADSITELSDSSTQNLSDSGTVNFTDVDAADVIDVTFASNSNISWSAGSIDSDLASKLVAGFTLGATGQAAPGSVNWTYSVTDADLNFLGKDETITFSYTVTVTDSQNATATDTVSFTITGTNDAPAIQVVDVTGTITEGTTLTDSGSITFTDVDLTDRPVATEATKSVTAKAQDGTTDLALTDAQKASIEAAFSIENVSTNTNDGTVNWTYDIAETDLNFLGQDEVVTAIFTITVTDDEGVTATQDVTVTITGNNDSPDIQVVDVTGTITEGTTLTDSGSITFTDVDLTDRPVATEATKSVTAKAQDGTTDLVLSDAQKASIEAAFSIENVSTNTNDGTVNWTYDIAETDLDFLGQGEVVTAIFTITVTDDEGVTATQDVTVTITGSNDSPDIQVVDVTGTITEGATLTDSGSITFSDVDLTDRPVATEATKSVTAKAQDGTTDLVLTDAQKASIEAAFSIENVSSNTNDGTVYWTYDIAETDLDFLGQGEVVTAVFTITVTDDENATATQDVTVTITGSNDTPVITVVDVNAAITEGSTLTDTGSITFTDVDLTDRPVATEATKSVTAKAQDGTTDLILTDAQKATIENAFSLENVSRNTNDGTVNWTYDIAETALDFLGQGEVVTAIFTITVTDGEGATATQDVTVTITGSNDIPDIQVVDTIGAIIEGSTLTDTGSVTFTDVDLTDRPVATEATKSVTAKAQDGTTDLALSDAQKASIEAAFSIENVSTNTNDGTVNWTYDIAETDLDFLGQGEVVTAIFTITVTDDEGVTAMQDVTVTITGSNDSPDIQVVDVTGTITEGTTLTDSGSITFTDVDLTDRPVATEATKSVTAKAQDGTSDLVLTDAQKASIEAAFSIENVSTNTNDGTVNWTYDIAETDLNFLGQGEVVTAIFTITVTDDEGVTATQDVTVTITGSNDAPIVSGTVANMSGTSGQIFTLVTLPANLFADVDNGETSKLVWSIENLPTGLVFNAATRTISGTPQGGFEGVNTLQVVATDSNGGQVKVPVTLTLKPSPVTPPVEANPNTTAPLQPLGGGADFNAPDVDPNVESLPSGLIDSGAGVSGFAGESADEVQLVNVAAPIDSAVSVVPSPTAESNGQGASNGVIVSESRVSVDVGANGQVRVTEGVGQLSNSTGLTIASMVTQADRVSISLSDTGVAASYSATLVDGSSLPSWVEVNPTTGEISMTPPSGQGKITLKINAVDASGNIRVLEVEVDLDQLPASVQDESTESATQANSAVFVPLDEQLAIAAEQFDEYGNDLMKLLAS